MSVYKRPGSDVYSYDFHHRRQRFSGQTGCTTKREAEQFEARERKRVEGLFHDATKPLTFTAAAARYWNEVGQFHRNHVDTLRSLDWLENQIGKNTMLNAISEATVAALIAKRRGDGVRNATVNRSVCEPLRAILRRASDTWGQTVQPVKWRRHVLKEAQDRTREASAGEELALKADIRHDYEPPLRFAFLTGCRRAEIVGLVWTRVDFINRRFAVIGKGDKLRYIPMTPGVYDLLWSLKDHHKDAVFTYVCRRARAGRLKGRRYPITMEGFKTAWRRSRKNSEVADFRFHDTRHTAATRLVRSTGNLKLAQRMLGHSEIGTTARYSHATDDDLRAGMEAAEADVAVKITTEVPTKTKIDRA